MAKKKDVFKDQTYLCNDIKSITKNGKTVNAKAVSCSRLPSKHRKKSRKTETFNIIIGSELNKFRT